MMKKEKGHMRKHAALQCATLERKDDEKEHQVT
jgi:hypothetical protein